MDQLYTYSLVPVLAVSLLLFFSMALHGRRTRGLAAYCLAIALWSGTLLLSLLPATAPIGQRLVATGGFVVAAYLHAATNLTDQRGFALVWLAYLVAAAISLVHFIWPGMLFDPLAPRIGPLFWPSMAAAGGASLFPLWHLYKFYRRAPADQLPALRGLGFTGVLGYMGAFTNALLLSLGIRLPVGLFVVLGSLFILAHVVQQRQDRRLRRLLQRSITYSAIAAVLSAGFLFGVLTFLDTSGQPLLTEYKLNALFLLCMAALAFEPLRQHLGQFFGKRLLKHSTDASELAEALELQEQRADQAARLAELGAFSSAVAHEVRGPLGVLTAQLQLLRRAELDPQTLDAMAGQIKRAERFVDDLLHYGRPRALELRKVELGALLKLAFSTSLAGLGLGEEVTLRVETSPEKINLEADQSQLLQLFVILFDNALLALESREDHGAAGEIKVCAHQEGEKVQITVEDSGPGIAPELLDHLFDPFVTGDRQHRRRSGTGLGLAIARAIIQRHGGVITAGCAPAGGARFSIHVPRRQGVMAAATGVP